ncbi:DUF3820 family protein [Marinirhabdus gelatinilytica]|uniref:DUF3820 family protein n=1 Tax=Marinirhabdus gelatinilytica TaxID=1703343 RepID=A0A370QB42_9FLAO|nr:DUF3820 family protein [Marinirhabdus gelatinilytica]RDK85596.1 hypothetical protein C8D94_103423 [Marinirhabdus gelatinilytica]
MNAGNYNNPNTFPDPEHLKELANYKMPFGKYKNQRLLTLPEAYFVWFKQKGFPKGKLGSMMQEMHEIKINGLESLLRPLVQD